MSLESAFPSVTFTDSNEVVGMLQVNFGIHRGPSWTIKEVRDMWKRVSVFLCDLIGASKSVQRWRELSFF